MTNETEPTPATPEEARRIIRRLILPHVFIVAIAAAAAVWVVLYVIKGEERKETAAPQSCSASQAAAGRAAPLAMGQVAALNIGKNPRPVADLAFKKADGTPVHLADFKGRTVLLNLWATWCVPCRQEMPALDRLQAKAGSKDFEVVAVNIDTSRLEKPKAFLDEIGVASLARYADPSADIFQVLKRAGKVLGLPTTILIGPDGCQIGVLAGPAEWDSPEALAVVKAAVGG